jgi:hypothetical protein
MNLKSRLDNIGGPFMANNGLYHGTNLVGAGSPQAWVGSPNHLRV